MKPKEKWRKLFGDREVPENQAVQKEFGVLLRRPLKPFLEKRGFDVRKVSHKGLEATPQFRTPYLHLTVDVRGDFPDRPEGALRGMEVLVVGVVYKGQGALGHPGDLYSHFPKPFTDKQKREWHVAKPSLFSNDTRTRVWFESPVDWFLENDDEIEMRVGNSCRCVIEKILDVASSVS